MKKFILAGFVSLLASCGSQSDKPWMIIGNKEIVKDSANVTINLNYPNITATSHLEVVQAVNNFGEKAAKAMLPESVFADSDYVKPVGEDGVELNFPYGADLHWSGQANEQIVELKLNSYLFTGGAHGMSNVWTKTFDVKTGAEVNLHSFVRDSSVILKFVADQLKADSIYTFEPLEKLPMPAVLAVDSVSLTAIYNQYEIAPYAVGIIEVPIHYSELGNAFDTTAIRPSTLRTINGK